MFTCYEEILSENKSSFPPQNRVLSFFKSPSGTRASSHVSLDAGGDDPDEQPTVQKEVSPP
jgi:hypothetical protein